MKEKKIPTRMCCVTREKFPKQDLLRIVKTPDGEIKVDLTGKLNGHGAYIKKDVDVVAKAIKTKALSRALECEIADSFYEEILSILK